MPSIYADDARVIKALADENRLHILNLLQSGEKCGCILLEELKIQQPTLSHHMKILCDAGLVDACKEGKWTHYSICTKGSMMLQELILRYTVPKEKAASYRKCSCSQTNG